MEKVQLFTELLQKIQNYSVWFFSTTMVVLILCVFSNSRMLQAQTAGLVVDYALVDASRFPLIVSSLTVRDGNNLLVGKLTENNFTVFEDGVLQEPITVEAFASDSGGVTVVLIMDISGSMRKELPDAKKAAITLINLLTQRDRGALLSFDRRAKLEQDFTSDMDQLKGAINSLKNGSGTAVYDATIEGLNLIKSQPGKKAMVLLTDGRDSNSKTDLDEVTKPLSMAKIPVYAIGLGVNPHRGEPELRAIANASGGLFFKAPSTDDLENIYRNIAFVITRFHYRITYATSNCATDSTIRFVKIEAEANGMAAADTSSYRAPKFAAKLAAQPDKAPTPTLPFTIKIATPNSSGFAKSISEISFNILYNTQYLNIRRPYEQNIVAGSVFGALSEHNVHFIVDDAAGVLNVHIKRNNASAAVSNSNVFAEITYIADVALPDSTALTFQIKAVQAKNTGHCTMIFKPQTTTIYSDGLIVWPGDTNFNGRVDLADVLILGQFWKLSGPSRPGIDNQLTWMPHVAKKYPVAKATHADADGGGQISERDLIPIGLNWGKSVNEYTPGASPKVAAILPEGELHTNLEQADLPGRYRLRIDVTRNNTAPLTGFVMRMRYPGELITIESVKTGGLWRNKPLKFVRNDVAENLLAISLMQPANAPSPENGGEILHIVFTAERPVSLNDITFDNTGLVGADGRINEIAITNKFDISDTKVPAALELLPAFPNPFNPQTTLRFDLAEPLRVSIFIFNISGKLVRKYEQGKQNAGTYEIHWNGTDEHAHAVSSGTYIVRLVATNPDGVSYIAEQKISLIK